MVNQTSFSSQCYYWSSIDHDHGWEELKQVLPHENLNNPRRWNHSLGSCAPQHIHWAKADVHTNATRIWDGCFHSEVWPNVRSTPTHCRNTVTAIRKKKKIYIRTTAAKYANGVSDNVVPSQTCHFGVFTIKLSSRAPPELSWLASHIDYNALSTVSCLKLWRQSASALALVEKSVLCSRCLRLWTLFFFFSFFGLGPHGDI